MRWGNYTGGKAAKISGGAGWTSGRAVRAGLSEQRPEGSECKASWGMATGGEKIQEAQKSQGRIEVITVNEESHCD